jgi:sec-independent protein translocase protein TatA
MGISVTHLLIFLVIVMVIFGAGKLPEVGKSLGQAINEFKKTVSPADKPKDDGDNHTV